MRVTNSFGIWLREWREQQGIQPKELALDLSSRLHVSEAKKISLDIVRNLEGQKNKPSRVFCEALWVLLEKRGFPPGIPHERQAFTRWARSGVLPNETTQVVDEMPTPFIGRLSEIKQITQWLLDGNDHLIAITGAPAMGKTRLARHIANQKVIFERFDGQIYAHTFRALESQDNFYFLLAQAIGKEFYRPPGEELFSKSPFEHLRDHIRGKRMLLILDSFEYLLPDRLVDLESLMDASNNLYVIVTSHERPNSRYERNFALQPLPYPEALKEPELKTDAVALFYKCAARHVAEPAALKKLAVLELNSVLGGHPYAIEFAAAALEDYSIEAYLARLAMGGGVYDILRTSFEVAWGGLNEVQHSFLRHLLAFHGRFDIKTAVEMMGSNEDEVRKLLRELCDKSLSHRPGVTPDGNQIYSIHQIIRRYMSEKAPLGDDIRLRHAQCFAHWVREHGEMLKGDTFLAAKTEMRDKYADILEAWKFAVYRVNIDLIDQMLFGLFKYYFTNDLFGEGSRVFGDAAVILESQPLESSHARILYGRVLASYAWFEMVLSSLANARAAAEKSLSYLAPLEENDSIVMHPYTTIGFIHFLTSEFPQALEFLIEGTSYQQQFGKDWASAWSHGLLGLIARMSQNYQEAEAQYRIAAQLASHVQDHNAIVAAENYLIDLLQQTGNLTDGDLKRLKSKIVEADKMGLKWSAMSGCLVLCKCYWNATSPNRTLALKYGREAVRYARQIQERKTELDAHIMLIGIAQQQTSFTEMYEHTVAAYRIAIQIEAAAPRAHLQALLEFMDKKQEQSPDFWELVYLLKETFNSSRQIWARAPQDQRERLAQSSPGDYTADDIEQILLSLQRTTDKKR